MVLLEHARRYCPDAVFIFTSTSKVYGDRPNALSFTETSTRYDLPKDHPGYNGITEAMSIDAATHSVFGASKAAADLMVQEYGRYFGLRTAVFRCGCIAGPSHQGARQHGFLSYLVRCAREGRPYTIYGYRGKQVRDNLHVSDLIAAFDAFYKNPKDGGAVYNMGGSRVSNTSILEAITWIENAGKARMRITFEDTPSVGDHRWYVSDVGKFQRDYPAWLVTRTTEQIIEDLWV